jgi:hypothetical protein
MATATTTPGKSDFIREVLGKNPQATFKAVNEAWTAAANEGSISQALVNKMRSEAGLSGNLRTRAKTKKQGKTEATAVEETPVTSPRKRGRKPKRRARDQGKTSFVKEFLNDHPEGKVKAVNEAWTKSGFDGSISPTLVNKMRSELGLTGNLRGKKAAAGKKLYTGKKRGRKPRGFIAEATTTAPKSEARGRKSALTLGLMDLEGEIDRLVFKVMGIGNLPEIEDSLRQVRRLVYGKLNQG